MRILIIEDEQRMADLLQQGLEENRYAVDITCTGEEGIILDIILPGKDGIEVCRSLRKNMVGTPILMLTCKDALQDKVIGLDSGADDYMVKPFSFEELYARVRAILRREKSPTMSKIICGDLVMDTVTRQVFHGNKSIELSGKEYAILEYLMRHPDAVITRTVMEQHVWNMALDSSSNLVDVYIKKLRTKLDEDRHKSLIQTIRGVGYRLRAK
jgi:DNA-binding response OmpR family regulator